jgi:mannose-6-phosphate isomerase-like protein (cupin superfamily)
MKLLKTGSRAFFKVIGRTPHAQAAMMTLSPGKATGEYANEHPRCEQWVFVVAGTGKARVGSRSVKITEGSLLLIERDEPHQVTCTGRTPLVALNLYVPPAYDAAGEVLPSAR